MSSNARVVTGIPDPGIERVVEAASRKGVTLDIRRISASARTAEDVAIAVEAEVGQIVTAIVFVAARPEGRLAPIVCLVSGRNQVDLVSLAAVAGEGAVRAATDGEARELTGYSIGAIPPFGYDSDVDILMDQDLSAYEWVWAAAGTDSTVFQVAPQTLRMLSNAVVAPVSAAI